MTDIFEDELLKFEQSTPLQWGHSGQRGRFLSSIKKELSFTNGRFRTARGGALISDVQSYIAAKIESGDFVSIKPSTRMRYSPAFPIRDDAAKRAHKKFSAQFLKKAFTLEGIVFQSSEMENKAIDLLAENFLPVDNPKTGLTFHMVSDTPVGSLPSSQGYGVSDLVGLVSGWADPEASRIAQLSHRAALRGQAAAMVPAGSKPGEIEKIADELQAFEKRSLRTNRTLPQISTAHIQDEFLKFFRLDGDQTNGAVLNAQKAVEQLDNLQPLKFAVQQTELPNPTEEHKF